MARLTPSRVDSTRSRIHFDGFASWFLYARDGGSTTGENRCNDAEDTRARATDGNGGGGHVQLMLVDGRRESLLAEVTGGSPRFLARAGANPNLPTFVQVGLHAWRCLSSAVCSSLLSTSIGHRQLDVATCFLLSAVHSCGCEDHSSHPESRCSFYKETAPSPPPAGYTRHGPTLSVHWGRRLTCFLCSSCTTIRTQVDPASHLRSR